MSVVQGAMKRFALFALAAVLALTLVPVVPGGTAYAATSGDLTGLSNGDIGLNFSGKADDAWSASGDTVTGSVQSTSGCGTTHYDSTLTISNKRDVAAQLSFDYTIDLQGGTAKVDEDAVTTGGSFSKKLEPGESIEVYIKSNSTNVPTKVDITHLILVADVTATTTFQPAENGSFTVNGNTIAGEYSSTQSSTQGYAVAATPASGYQFVGWYDVTNGKYISTEASTTLNMEYGATVTAKFAPIGVALFDAGGQVFDDLDKATAYAVDNGITKVTLVGDGTLTGNHVIPSGVVLLIPFDNAKTLYTDTPVALYGGGGNRVAYKTLTMAEGSTLTAEGGISVGGRYNAAAGSAAGYMTGAYGLIKMEAGSQIDVKSGGALYAWGFVAGDGNVAVESGGNVYEWYQIADFRGGTATTAMGNKVFPFSQYFVQNVEVALTLNAGAKEVVYTGVYASSKINNASITFIGDSGMFKVVSGSVTKKYNGAADRLEFTINGEVELNNLSLKLMGVNVNSRDYVLPITNNISLEIASGGILKVNQTAALLAGVQAIIDQGAELRISDGVSVYLYDRDEWTADNYVTGGKFKNVTFALGKNYNRTVDDLVDAKIDVNGTMTAAGSVYTTKGGADICSSQGTGVYQQTGDPGTEAVTYQYTQNNSAMTSHEIAITAAKLRNADGTYTETATASAGDTINYVNGFWGDSPAEEVAITFNANDGEGSMNNQTIKSGVDTALNANTFTREGYTFAGWNTAADGSGTSYENEATVSFTEDTTLYAQWQINTYTVTWVDENGTELEKDENVAYGTTPEYNGETPTKESDAQYSYTFKGWAPEVSAATADVTYKAVYEQTVNQYTITWKNWDDTELKTEQVAYGEVPAYTGETPTREGDAEHTYTFSGWTPVITAVTGNAEYTAVFTDAINTYTVIWKNWDGTVLETDEDVEYGTTPEYSGEIPTKEGDARYSYTFKGWSPAVDTVTGDIIYTAVYEQTVNQYTITWKNWDGTEIKTEQVAYGDIPVYAGETPTKAKDSQYSYTFKGWTPEIAAVTGEATYTAAYAKTGWVTDEKGTTYVVEDEVLYQEGIGVIDGEIYWFEGDYLAENKGLVRIEEDNDVKYYFFGANGKAARGTDDGLVKVWVGKDPTGKDLTNGLLPAWDYVFGTDGVIVHDAKLQNGIHPDDGDVLCYYIDGIKVHKGMFKIDDDYYYAKGTGELVVNAKYYCTDVNGLMPEGPYTFDEHGKMVRPDTSKNGIVAENGSLYYYVNGELNYAGLIKIDNYLYYVKTSGEVIHGKSYWITKTNGLMPEKSYAFADDGRMIGYDASKNGIVKEDDGSLYYYQNGAITYAGLIQIDGDYYYVKTSGEVVHGKSYWISKTNGLLPEKSYTFADDGKIVL